MKIQINKPTDVYEHIGKTYANTAMYSELLASCDKDLADLGMELEQFADSLNREQRECMICLDSLQRSSGNQEQSQEAERQRQQYIEKIESCKRKRNRLRIINEEYSVLVRESQKLQQDAHSISDRLKQPVMSVRKVIEKFLSSL